MPKRLSCSRRIVLHRELATHRSLIAHMNACGRSQQQLQQRGRQDVTEKEWSETSFKYKYVVTSQ